MTPTEQDKELQNWLVEHTALIEETGEAVWRELEVETFMYHLRELITADRKRVALEAELGLLTYMLDERTEHMFMQSQDTGEMTGNGWLCNTSLSAVSANRIEAERRKRIAELKAQQEEV